MKKDTPENLMKTLLISSLDHFTIDDLFDMLYESCNPDQEEELKDKWKDALTINGGVFIVETNLATEPLLKSFCKSNDIKLLGYYD